MGSSASLAGGVAACTTSVQPGDGDAVLLVPLFLLRFGERHRLTPHFPFGAAFVIRFDGRHRLVSLGLFDMVYSLLN